MSVPQRDLRALARQVMLEEGFAPDVPPAVAAEIAQDRATPAAAARDLRALLWSSIDNRESRDLDQIEHAERLDGGDIRVRVGIADVDARVPAGSATDQYAEVNATSVYAGVATFPMLPERLSTDLTSLAEGGDRLAVVIELVVAESGDVRSSDVYRALVHNYARLDYDSVGAWLAGAAPAPPRVAATAGMMEQIRLQDQAAGRLRVFRERQGALEFETIEASVVAVDGKVTDLVVKRKGPANRLVESFMIAANITIATFLKRGGVPSIQRAVRTPERWPRIVELAAALGERLPPEPDVRALAAFLDRRRQADPAGFPDLSLAVVKLLGAGEYIVEPPGVEVAGHFGLAARDYTHATAPNRRYVDLVIQRLAKALLAGRPIPYDAAALEAIARHCDERDHAAGQAERRMRKYAAIDLMGRRIGESFDAIVTGVAAKGTFARLVAPPVEGRIVQGEAGLDVGDHLRVRLVSVDPDRGFIDFARLS